MTPTCHPKQGSASWSSLPLAHPSPLRVAYPHEDMDVEPAICPPSIRSSSLRTSHEARCVSCPFANDKCSTHIIGGMMHGVCPRGTSSVPPLYSPAPIFHGSTSRVLPSFQHTPPSPQRPWPSLQSIRERLHHSRLQHQAEVDSTSASYRTAAAIPLRRLRPSSTRATSSTPRLSSPHIFPEILTETEK